MDSTPGWLTDHFWFLTFGNSGAQPWAPESVIQPGVESQNYSVGILGTLS